MFSNKEINNDIGTIIFENIINSIAFNYQTILQYLRLTPHGGKLAVRLFWPRGIYEALRSVNSIRKCTHTNETFA